MLINCSKDTFSRPFYHASNSIFKVSYLKKIFAKSKSVDLSKLNRDCMVTYKHYVFTEQKQRYRFLRRVKKLMPNVGVIHKQYCQHQPPIEFSRKPYSRTSHCHNNELIILSTDTVDYDTKFKTVYHIAVPVWSLVKHRDNAWNIQALFPCNSISCMCCGFKKKHWSKTCSSDPNLHLIFNADLFSRKENRNEFICSYCKNNIDINYGRTNGEELLTKAILLASKDKSNHLQVLKE